MKIFIKQSLKGETILKPKKSITNLNHQFEKCLIKKLKSSKKEILDEIAEFLESKRAAELDEAFFAREGMFTDYQKKKIIKYILKKDKKFRNEAEITFIAGQLNQASFIQKIKTQISEVEFSEFLKNLKFEKYPSKKTVFHIGDEGNKFYLILQGQVLVLIPMITKHLTRKEIKNSTTMITIDQIEYIKHSRNIAELMANQICTAQIDKEQFIEEVSDPSIGTSTKIEMVRCILENNPELRLIRILSTWDQFGEIALFNKAARSATIIAFTPCKFATINSISFQKILKTYQDNVFRKYMRFLACVSLFENWPQNKLTQVKADLVIDNYIKGQVVFNEGDVINNFFIVEEGQIELTKQIRIENQQSVHLEIDKVI